MRNYLLNIYFYLSILFNQSLIGIVNIKDKNISYLPLTNILPLFIYLPYINFYNLSYLYLSEDKIKIEDNKKRVLKISPLVSNIKVTNKSNFKDISYINDKYSHNIPFWVIFCLEDINEYDNILLTKNTILSQEIVSNSIYNILNNSISDITN